jgi:tRNA pseudouridine38-40 synthase
MSERIALAIRYDGARYHGWQAQHGLPTVQGAVEKAISSVANHGIHVVCAGRTDAGVHASAQIAHFDTSSERSDKSWVFGANSNLPSDISVLWAKPVERDFHARFSATARTYRYLIYNHPVRPGILRHAVGWHHKHLDEKLMQEAGQHLFGQHDFSSFRGSGCEAKTPNRNLSCLSVKRRGRMLIIEVKANAFLLHMVRNLVGVLITIGSGSKPPIWAKEVLEARDRCAGAMTIAPNGLYLVVVDYPQSYALPESPVGPFFLA